MTDMVSKKTAIGLQIVLWSGLVGVMLLVWRFQSANGTL